MSDERKVFTLAEVSQHNHSKDCWLVIHGNVYNVTEFLEDHPGGDEVLLSSAGKDASNDFNEVGHSTSAIEMMDKFYVGMLNTRMGGEHKVFTLAEVSQHNHSKDCWLVIHGNVYNVTEFLEDHPGGDEVLLSSAGKDASNDFDDVGHSTSAIEMMDVFYVGDIDTSIIPTKDKLVMALQDDELHFKSFVARDVIETDELLMALEDDELHFNSATLKELSETLQDDSIDLIGLYGKPGSGKTTLVEAVRDKVKSLKIFDEVLFVSMFLINLINIQLQVAESLNMKFVSEGQFGRAREINSTLAGMTRILVILDGVLTKFDPDKYLGISCNDKRCKFLLTARNKQDCILMLGEREIHCQRIIHMPPLSPYDALRLLQEHSNIQNDESNISNVANEIAFEYEWFPGTIKKIGSSLKDEPLMEWEGLLDSLRHSTARYQIFLSFRGQDTSHHFTSTLCAELRNNGFKTFMHDAKFTNGDSISTKLIKAIDDSRLSIIILSEKYAGSSWCLDELVHILECMKTKKQLVWPIFYKVEPIHVRHQAGDFGIAMAELEEKFKNDPKRIKKWKSALVEVAKLKALSYNGGRMSQLKYIHGIVEMATHKKNYLYIKSMNIDSDMEDEMEEEIKWSNDNHKIEPFLTPTPSSDPSSSHNFVQSKSQTQSSYSNLQSLGSESSSSSNSMSFTQESPDLFLEALEDDELSFNSKTLKELSKVLQDDNINKIGLYGQPDSGKTALVETVRDKIKSLNIFDKVLFARVSKNPNIRSIQEQIAKSLSLTLVNVSPYKRAWEIGSTLKSIKRILVILDDVPAKFDPDCLGIPCDDRGCKILLTTRCRQDCTLMIFEKETDCQKKIPMRHLSKEAAWKLLQKHLSIEEEEEDDDDDDDDGDDDESLSNLLTVAKEIAFKYKWLPGTIKKIGSSFRGDLEKWKGLLASLRHASARYQIFLSFRGRDTRTNFTSSLNDELKKNGFKTFMDNDQLRTGDSISTELIQAIEDSRLSIAILSENYPESSWCLEELVHILQCKESKKQLVWPIFYEVEPRDIGRHQTKDGENTMAKLEKKFKDDPDKINKWKSALAQVSKISGRNYNEAAVGFSQPKFIREIINSAKEYRNNYLYIRNMDMD